MEHVPFYSPDLDRTDNRPTIEAIDSVLGILNDTHLRDEVLAGNITLAMIRPNVGPEANTEGLSDTECAEQIEGMIKGLGVVTKFSFQFTKNAAEEFYGGGPEESMSKENPRNPDKYQTRWPEFIDFITSGPTTVSLLHNPDGDAITKWRSHLGHWNIDEVRDMNTIRGQLGVNRYNNLVHGSDAPEAVLRELSIIARCLSEKRESLVR